MKLIQKISIILCAAVLLCLPLSGCFSQTSEEKTYSFDELSITMEGGFRKVDAQAVTYYLQSKKAIFTALKEPFSSLSSLDITPESSLSEYMQVVITSNKLDDAEVKDGENGTYQYLIYEKDTGGKTYFYTVVAVKGSDAFWLVNFACPTGNREAYAEKFLDWANTITVK